MAFLSNPEPNTLALQGEIDLHESPQIKERLQQMITAKPNRLFIDLSGVNYIDSSGLAAFIEAMQQIHTYGGKLVLIGLRENVMDIFHISRLDQVFKIFPDKASAVAALG